MSYFLLILSVILGAILVLFKKPNKNLVRLLLAFSGAYLLSVTILHLLPEVYKHTSNVKNVGILILVGILLQSVLESFSKGAEHGHIHLHTNDKKFPWLLFVSLCIHAFSEGLPIHHANDNLLWAIIVHKIPIAIVLTTFLLHAKYSKQKVILFLGLFSLMSPLGMFLSNYLPILETYNTEITAFIIGVFLHISTIILFESTENHKFNFQKFGAILLGILLTVFTL
ncbi:MULTISPECIES: ZIP family metal transporter [Tenacibaculum]|uniref:ZIP family metal transporter n=1 Tax=Tenacibaculum TaxID=104267 RepID=UPI001F0B70C2|nr:MULTISPECIES: ZIP family metal transporter [Tenacibaculum]MCH3882343.1 ZIP family metal transporter [Tenacibaculum aquimarinum]MCH3885353.1 ZIP family metal transporter [Tenacibaculum aquimarinum]MDO6600990.1 ZIP family metal transporter [Tenacibaculum sp. 1_MG-2023]